ncbi:hypothetical protein GCM10027346_33120 [Hymenobacter seoulensis]
MKHFATIVLLLVGSATCVPLAGKAAQPDPKAAATRLPAKKSFLAKLLPKKAAGESRYARAIRRNELFRAPQAPSR